jgi:hypothetical protein
MVQWHWIEMQHWKNCWMQVSLCSPSCTKSPWTELHGEKPTSTFLSYGPTGIYPMSFFNFLSMHYRYYSLTHGAEPFLRSRQLCSHSTTSQHFMEPEGSLLCSQEPPLFPILSQINPIQSIYLQSTLILSTHLRLGLPSGLFPSGFPTIILYAFGFPHSCYTPCSSHPPWIDHYNHFALWGMESNWVHLARQPMIGLL